MKETDLLRERARVAEELITRAWSDEAFKALLMADPAKAVEAAYGLKLPASVTLKVLEETEDTRYLVVPYRPSTADELTDEDLAAVAGGMSASNEVTSGGSTRSTILRGISISNPLASTTQIDGMTSNLSQSVNTMC